MIVRELRPDTLAEDHFVRQQAGRQGWQVDDDGWFWRMRRPGDPEMTGSNASGFTHDDRVYVASCEDALRYDRGEAKLQKATQ